MLLFSLTQEKKEEALSSLQYDLLSQEMAISDVSSDAETIIDYKNNTDQYLYTE